MKKHVLFIIVVIAGLVAAKALLAREPDQGASNSTECVNPVFGSIILKLRAVETDPLRVNTQLNLNSRRQFETTNYEESYGQVFEQGKTVEQQLQKAFVSNNIVPSKSAPIQSSFINGADHGKSPKGATGIRLSSAMMRINFEKRMRLNGEKSFAAQEKEANRELVNNKIYTAKTLNKILSYKRLLNKILSSISKLENVEFVYPECKNVAATTAPQSPDDEVHTDGFTWGLDNQRRIFGGVAGAHVNFNPAWQKLYEVRQHYQNPITGILGVIGAGLDDSPTGQNIDLRNVVWGANTDPVGGGPYTLYTGSLHELWVTGILAAKPNNIRGIPGIIDGSQIPIFLGVFNDGVTPLTNANLIYALDQTAQNSKIINISYGISGDDPAVRTAIGDISALGVLMIFGAGNDGTNLDIRPLPPGFATYPCAYNSTPGLETITSGVICVAGMDPDGNRGFFGGGSSTNWGRQSVHVFAPAVGIFTTDPGDGWSPGSGTSLAAPFTTGLAVMLAEIRPSLLNKTSEIKNLIIDLANKRDVTELLGLELYARGGVPDFYKVLKAAEALIPCGDSNSDGFVTEDDAYQVAGAVVGVDQVDDRIAADVTGDGILNANDAFLIAQKAAGYPVALSCQGSSY